MEIYKGRSMQNLPLNQPLNLNPSHKKPVVSVSSDYSLRWAKSSFSTTVGEVTSSMQPSLGGTVLKKARLTNDSLRTSDLKLSNKFLENLSILKGFKTYDGLEKTKTQKSTHNTDQGGLHPKSLILKGWHVVLDLDKSKTSFQERLGLTNEILSHGGIVGFSVTKKTTHLLVDGIQKRSHSFKRHCAQKYGVDVVSVDYVRDCLESGCVLKVEPYIAADRVDENENKENNLLSGKIKASGKQRGVLTEKPVKGTGEDTKLKSVVWEDVHLRKDNYQIAKFCFMKHKTNEEECLQLELHVLTESVGSRFRIFYQHKQNKSFHEKCCTVSSSLQAVSLFCKISKSLQDSYSVADVKSVIVGSPKFEKMQMETQPISADRLNTSVKTLVDVVWKEAIGSASSSVDITSVTTEKVNKASVTLAQIKRMLIEGGATEKQLQDKSKQFFSQICHKGTLDVIDSKRILNQMQELCTLLQDVMNVQEASNWKKDVNISNKYRSLRCHIQSVATYSSQYKTVMSTIGKEALESSRIQVTGVYSLARPLEDSIYSPKGRKVASLVHATRPTSLLGILSRGLLLPRIVQEDVGIERRDFGFLGQGIYFGDDIRSNIHFTEPNQCTKTRFLLMCEVIVGKQYETCQHQPDFVSPPSGYDSVLGIKNSGGNHSMFKHNEYTIYNVGQQRLSYLIEFVQVDETPVIYQPELSIEDIEEPSDEGGSKEIDVSDVMDVSDPLDKVTPGLQTSGGQPVLLERVSVKAKMMDLVAQVTVFQRYRNTNTKPIEAKYVFPLDDTAAVSGFEAFIGDKHIVGEVKEKETAHKEYKEAVSQGHGAYLMDEEAADVFTVSVGNLPPSTEVIIKIIYIIELSLDDDQIVFHLPGSLASWRKEGALAEETQNVTSTVATGDNEKIKFEMSLSMEMPFDIQTIKCSTHDIKIKRTAAKACITLAEREDCLKEGFHLSVKLHKIHQPHMWVEQNPNNKDSQSCMLTFYPEFEFPRLNKPDVTVILDCSNSMKGESFEHAKKVCYMIASLMPKTYTVNFIKFGTTFKELYPLSRLSSKIDFDELKDFLAEASPAEGNTDVWRPLHSHYLLEGEDVRNVFVISDGHVSNETETLKSIAKNSSHTRIFTFGVSTTCNKHMLKIMARSGAGFFEFFDGNTKSAWQRKVKNQLQRAGQPSVNSLSINWHQYDSYAPKPRQAPRHLGALFSGSRLVVYGFVPYCTSATLTAVIDGQEISTIVSTSDLCITKGLTLHRLTARALIRDWEDGMLDVDRIEEEITKEKEKEAIISLSRQYSIVTSLTSFVAIEKREKHEVQKKLNMEEKLQELLKMEDVDVLPYMDWQLRQEVTLDLDDKDKLEYESEEDEDAVSSYSDESSIEKKQRRVQHLSDEEDSDSEKEDGGQNADEGEEITRKIFEGREDEHDKTKEKAPNSLETMVKNGTTQQVHESHQVITAMKQYEVKSFEELRMEDYAANRKGTTETGILGMGMTQTGSKTAGLFGQKSTTSGGFSFGNQRSQPLMFGGTAGTFGTSGGLFGQANTSKQQGGLFGATKRAFVQTTQSSSLFGNTGTTSLFGQNTGQKSLFTEQTSTTQTTTPLFGSSTSAFGTMSFGQNTFGQDAFGQENQTESLFLTPRGTSTGSAGLTFGNQNKPGLTLGAGTGTAFGRSTDGVLFGDKGTASLGTGLGTRGTFGSASGFTFGSGTTGDPALFGNNNKTTGFGSSLGNTDSRPPGQRPPVLYSGLPRPPVSNSGPPRPTFSNSGLPRPPVSNSGPPRPTFSNSRLLKLGQTDSASSLPPPSRKQPPRPQTGVPHSLPPTQKSRFSSENLPPVPPPANKVTHSRQPPPPPLTVNRRSHRVSGAFPPPPPPPGITRQRDSNPPPPPLLSKNRISLRQPPPPRPPSSPRPACGRRSVVPPPPPPLWGPPSGALKNSGRPPPLLKNLDSPGPPPPVPGRMGIHPPQPPDQSSQTSMICADDVEEYEKKRGTDKKEVNDVEKQRRESFIIDLRRKLQEKRRPTGIIHQEQSSSSPPPTSARPGASGHDPDSAPSVSEGLRESLQKNTEMISDLNLRVEELEITVQARDDELLQATVKVNAYADEVKNLEKAVLEAKRTIMALRHEQQTLRQMCSKQEETLQKLSQENADLISLLETVRREKGEKVKDDDELKDNNNEMTSTPSVQVSISAPVGPLFEASKFCLEPSVPDKCLITSIDAHESEVNAVRFFPSGSMFATAGNDTSGSMFATAGNDTSGSMFATAGNDKKVKVWGISTDCFINKGTLLGSNAGVTSIDFDVQEQFLLAGSSDFAIRVWLMDDHTLWHTLTGHSGSVLVARFLSDPNRIVSGSYDRTLKIWDLRNRVCTRSIFARSRCNDLVTTDGAGTNIISGHLDRRIRFWDIRSDSQTSDILLQGKITSLDVSQTDRNLLLCCTKEDDRLQLIDLRMNRTLQTCIADGFEVFCYWTRAVLSPDACYASAGSKNGSVYIWNLKSGQLEKVLKKHEAPVIAVSWHPTGHQMLSCDRNKTVVLWGDS